MNSCLIAVLVDRGAGGLCPDVGYENTPSSSYAPLGVNTGLDLLLDDLRAGGGRSEVSMSLSTSESVKLTGCPKRSDLSRSSTTVGREFFRLKLAVREVGCGER